MANGTLAQLLHEKTENETEPDWPRRLGIAIGVSEDLSFLHQIATIHLDITSSNIYLYAYYGAVIREIEISKLLDPTKGTASISAVAGSFGYIPPGILNMHIQYKSRHQEMCIVSEWVLLEILTSRFPVDEAFGEGIDLVKWVQNTSGRSETPQQIMDARLSTVSFAWRKQMLAVLKIALLCTDSTLAKCPKMKKVVEMLLEAKEN